MSSALNIQLGRFAIARRTIAKDKLEVIIRGWMETAGIETAIEVSIEEHADLLIINDMVCRFPGALIRQVEDYSEFLKMTTEFPFWELLIPQVLWLEAGAFVSEDMVRLLMPGIQEPETTRRCREIVDELLSLGITLRNKSLIAEISEKHLGNPEVAWNDFREELIERLASPGIALFFNKDYFSDIIAGSGKENLFELMRDGLFYELGIRYPPFIISFDDELPYQAFYFSINAYTSLPLVGLKGGAEILVNESVEKLKLMGIEGKAAVNPANGNPICIVYIKEQHNPVLSGMITWNSFGYFILCLSGFLRVNGYRIVNRQLLVQYQQKLASIFPKSTEMLESSQLLPVSVKVLRLLAKEQISIRNLRVILEGILESDYIVADGNTHVILDERVPVKNGENGQWKQRAENVVEFVRTRLRRYISHKYTKGQQSLQVYLLDPAIEKLFDGDGPNPVWPDPVDIFRIQQAIENELGNLPVSAPVPIILTTISVRAHFKRVIENRFPGIVVLSYQELVADMNLQPIARISLD